MDISFLQRHQKEKLYIVYSLMYVCWFFRNQKRQEFKTNRPNFLCLYLTATWRFGKGFMNVQNLNIYFFPKYLFFFILKIRQKITKISTKSWALVRSKDFYKLIFFFNKFGCYVCFKWVVTPTLQTRKK